MSTDKEKQMLTFEGRPSRGRLRLCNFTSGRKEEEKKATDSSSTLLLPLPFNLGHRYLVLLLLCCLATEFTVLLLKCTAAINSGTKRTAATAAALSEDEYMHTHSQ